MVHTEAIMKKFVTLLLFLPLFCWAQHGGGGPGSSAENPGGNDSGGTPPSVTLLSPEMALETFTTNAKLIPTDPIRYLPLQHSGRIKPLDSLARELTLFVMGSYSRFGLSATQIFLNMMSLFSIFYT